MDMMNNDNTPLIGKFRLTSLRMFKGIIYSILMIAAIMPLSLAHAAQAVAMVSKNIVAVNEVFQLTIVIDDSVNPDSLDLSPLEKHFSLGNPFTRNYKQWNNGVTNHKTEWRIALATKEVGEFTIPSFRIGATTTDPIIITSSNSTSTSQGKNQPAIKLDYDLDKKQLYVGENIHYQLRIHIGEKINQPALTPPSGDGLNVKQIGKDRQTETVLNGLRYVILVRDYQIKPTKSGSILLHGAELSGSVNKGGRGFGSSKQIPVSLRTEDVTLSVKSKPASYQGFWLPTEDLQLEQQWQPVTKEVKVGEPLTRTITLRIKNTEQSNMPNLSLTYPNKVKVYDEKPVYGDDGDYTVMTIKQVIIPRDEGQLSLPPLSVNWWNTQKEQQETSQIDGLELNILPGESTNNLNLPVVTTPATEITDVQNSVPLAPAEVKIVTDAGWWPWLTALFAGLWLTTTVLWLRARSSQRAVLTGSSQPQTAAIAPLAGMKQAVEARQPIKVHNYYKQWAESNPTHPQKEALYQQVTAMMNAHFSKEPEQWDSKELMKLLNSLKIHKVIKQKGINNQQALAPLVPGK